MIRYVYRTTRDDRPRLVDQFRAGCWVDVIAPTEDELLELEDKFELDIGQLRDALDPFEVPRIEKEDDFLYIFARIPHQVKSWQTTTPVLFILGDTFFITISQEDTGIRQR